MAQVVFSMRDDNRFELVRWGISLPRVELRSVLSIGLAYEILQQTSSRKKGNLKEAERWNKKELKEKEKEAQEDVFGNAGAGDAKKGQPLTARTTPQLGRHKAKCAEDTRPRLRYQMDTIVCKGNFPNKKAQAEISL